MDKSKYPSPGSVPRNPVALFGMAIITSDTYRHTKLRLHENDLPYALGNFKTFSNPSHIPTLNEEGRQYLNKLKRAPEKLHRHFDSNNGRIKQQE